MKRFWILVAIIFILSIISGLLIAQMSFAGRMGITFFYKEMAIFKVWWQTAALFFGIQFLLILLQTLAKTNWLSIILFVLALAGLIYTFINFNHAFSYRLLKEKLHMGFYLFFITTMIHNLYFIFSNHSRNITPV